MDTSDHMTARDFAWAYDRHVFNICEEPERYISAFEDELREAAPEARVVTNGLTTWPVPVMKAVARIKVGPLWPLHLCPVPAGA